MLTNIQEALNRVRCEIIGNEEPYHGEVPESPGIWAAGKTLVEKLGFECLFNVVSAHTWEDAVAQNNTKLVSGDRR